MKIKFSPSIMCSKPWDMLTYIKEFEKSGMESIHYDVMDGSYVPNIMLGTETFKAIHGVTEIPIDMHIMCQNPMQVVDYFDLKENDRVCFHPQTTPASYSLLKKIKDMGCYAGIALNPGTPIDHIEELKDLLDYVLVMSVEPGSSGQKMLPSSFDKVERIIKIRENNNLNFDIMIDGNCNAVNVKKMIAAGANHFVIGTALLNNAVQPYNYSVAFDEYKKEIGI